MHRLGSTSFCVISVRATVIALYLLSLESPVRGDDLSNALTGKWIVIKETKEGRTSTFSIGTTIVIERDVARSYDRNGELWDTGTLSVRIGGKQSRIEFTPTEGESQVGVFRLHDDTLEVYWGVEKWPTTFKEHSEQGAHYVQFTRVGTPRSLAPTGGGDSNPPEPRYVRRAVAMRTWACWRGYRSKRAWPCKCCTGTAGA